MVNAGTFFDTGERSIDTPFSWMRSKDGGCFFR